MAAGKVTDLSMEAQKGVLLLRKKSLYIKKTKRLETGSKLVA